MKKLSSNECTTTECLNPYAIGSVAVSERNSTARFPLFVTIAMSITTLNAILQGAGTLNRVVHFVEESKQGVVLPFTWQVELFVEIPLSISSMCSAILILCNAKIGIYFAWAQLFIFSIFVLFIVLAGLENPPIEQLVPGFHGMSGLMQDFMLSLKRRDRLVDGFFILIHLGFETLFLVGVFRYKNWFRKNVV